MVLYNVTVKIDHSAHQEWRQWMLNKHIPDVMATGMFADYRFCRLLGEGEEDGITYAIQYLAHSMASFQIYQERFAKDLQAEHTHHFSGKYVAFRTLLEVVDRGS
jgi:hypothetical protein